MTVRPRSATFPNATLQQFRDLFQLKQQYRAAIEEMSVKERLVNWKPTSELEEAFWSHLVDRDLVKVGAGMMKVTTYRLADRPSECKAYMSFGGQGLRLTAEGREQDIGFFLTAEQTPNGLAVSVKSKHEHYINRTRLIKAVVGVVGVIALFPLVVPGVMILTGLVAFQVFGPRLFDRQVERHIWPPLTKLLGPRR